MPNYKGLGESLSGAIGTGYEAQSKAYERQGSEELYKYKEQQRANLFDVLYGAMGMGSNLYEIYSGNKDIIDWGTKNEYEVTTDWLTNLFGTPEFKKGEDVFTASELSARKLLGE